jgi:hypothetical protein
MNVEPANWSPEERAAFMARRESRNRALGILLFALVALFFGITVVRMAGQPLPAPPIAGAPQGAPQ